MSAKELNIGDYVRTKDYGIAKIIDSRITKKGGDIYCTVQTIYTTYITDNNLYLTDGDIIKSSSNIIDLIEVGDYVNGRIVEWVADNFVAFGRLDYAYKKDIKSIVTKEQFESIEYKIGDKENENIK